MRRNREDVEEGENESGSVSNGSGRFNRNLASFGGAADHVR
jgi:hypothetical protein